MSLLTLDDFSHVLMLCTAYTSEMTLDMTNYVSIYSVLTAVEFLNKCFCDYVAVFDLTLLMCTSTSSHTSVCISTTTECIC